MGKSRLYTPGEADIGCVLKCEIESIDAGSRYDSVTKTFTVSTNRVRPAATPPKRALVPITPPHQCVRDGRFTVLTYNLLADLYATVRCVCFSILPPLGLRPISSSLVNDRFAAGANGSSAAISTPHTPSPSCD